MGEKDFSGAVGLVGILIGGEFVFDEGIYSF